MGVHIKRAAVSTGVVDSTQDITITGIGTPVAALFFITSSTTDNQDATHGIFGVGALAVETQKFIGIACENGLTTSNSANKFVNNAAVVSLDQNGAVTGAATVAFISDGVRLTIKDQFPAAYFVNVMFLVGDYLTDVIEFDSADTAFTLPGSKPPDWMFAVGIDESLHGASTAYASTAGAAVANISLGMLTFNYDGTSSQRSIGFYYPDGRVSGSAGANTSAGANCSSNQFLFNADPVNTGAELIATRTATGVSLSNTNCTGFFLTVNFKGNNFVEMGGTTAPTVATNPLDQNLSFDPIFIIEFHSVTLSGLRSSYGTAFGIGFAGTDSPDDYSLGVRAFTGVFENDLGICGAWNSQNTVCTVRNDGTPLDTTVPVANSMRALFTSFGTKKYTKNLQTVDGSARQWVYMGFGSPSTASKVRNYYRQMSGV
jgi:hypothetical protein